MPSLISPDNPGGLAASLQSLIQGSSGGPQGNADDNRAALVFSSDLRKRIHEDALSRQAQVAEQLEAQQSISGLTNFSLVNNGPGIAVSRGLVNVLKPKLEDITGQVLRSVPRIVMELNPNNIEFEQPKRYTRQDTQRGTVFHHFTNSQGQNNDVLTIKFAGNTGNIARRGRSGDEIVDRAVTRLKIWHDLYQLTREPVILTDGTFNTMYVSYVSPLFPVVIQFSGFWTHVLRFSENAKKPSSRDYTMEFVVKETFPDMNTISDLILDQVVQEASLAPSATSTVLTSTP